MSLDFLHLHDSSVQNFDFLNQRYLVELDQLFFPLEDTSHVADFLISSLETLVGLTEPHYFLLEVRYLSQVVVYRGLIVLE
jgi:hypothetical protein